MSVQTENLIKTPLYEAHRQKNAKMIPFAGYMLPVWFSAIKPEHLAVRESVGCFDISHMGLFLLKGDQAFSLLQRLSCNNVEKSKTGAMVYTMILNEKGGILDDVMVGSTKEGFLLVVNAANKKKIRAWLDAHNRANVPITDLNETHGFIAVQGPTASTIVGKMLTDHVSAQPRFTIKNARFRDRDVLVSRTGYTGEDGFEIICPNDAIVSLWNELLKEGVTPCGLGARDTLRIEAGLPLYGQELSEEITPLMTRYAKWVIKFDHDFIGRQALEPEKNKPPRLVTAGVLMAERIIPRTGYQVREGGHITSGTLSPLLNKAVAMALIKPELAEIGNTVNVVIRDVPYKGEIVSLPFIE